MTFPASSSQHAARLLAVKPGTGVNKFSQKWTYDRQNGYAWTVSVGIISTTQMLGYSCCRALSSVLLCAVTANGSFRSLCSHESLHHSLVKSYTKHPEQGDGTCSKHCFVMGFVIKGNRLQANEEQHA